MYSGINTEEDGRDANKDNIHSPAYVWWWFPAVVDIVYGCIVRERMAHVGRVVTEVKDAVLWEQRTARECDMLNTSYC